MAGIRSFVAVELPDEIKGVLAELQGDLKAQLPSKAVRWTRPESIHLTLQFLGDVAPGKVEGVAGALREVCARQTPFTFELEGIGVFPNPGRPRVVWVGVAEPGGALVALQKEVVGALAPLGFEAERRPYTPHLTIGRAARDAGRRELAEVGELITRTEVGTLGQVSVEHITLMKSDLQPGGAVYTPLAVLPFSE
ncbi:MAG: RNA 2',3'-cyclic phosphodiesterase [Anaerolineae bacterium]